MKITNIEEKDNIYMVTFTPNFIERFLGVKEKIEKYRDTGSIYEFGGGHVYRRQDGSNITNWDSVGDAIDKWRRKW
jgi:hypothetical protein